MFKATYYIIFMIVVFALQSYGQINPDMTADRQWNSLVLPQLDNTALWQEELFRRNSGMAPHFAVARNTDISPETHGVWTIEAAGRARWQLQIKSPGAYSLNLGFSKFNLPASAELYLSTPDAAKTNGPFTPSDNDSHEQFWTPVMRGDEIHIELLVDVAHKDELLLQLGFVNHDFMNIFNRTSGNCHLDVACSAEDNWAEVDNCRDVMRSVALITVNGTGFCSGFLVNNHKQDCRPLFMTAAHCEIGILLAPSLVFYWNYENPTCREPGSIESGLPGNGELDVFNTGSGLRAEYEATDMTLLELDDPVNEAANAFFAGWSAEDAAPGNGVTIHHPEGEEKRISFEQDASFVTQAYTEFSDPQGTHIMIPDWDIGTTEPGSSGAPLFDENKRAVGQLQGGSAACGNDQPDWYGRFAMSWEGGGNPDSRLRDWFDPEGTGILVLDGREQQACLVTDLSVIPSLSGFEECITAAVNFMLTIGTGFSGPVALSVSGNPAGTSVSFSPEVANPGDAVAVSVDHADFAGFYELFIEVNDGTNIGSTTIDINIIPLPENMELMLPQNGAEGVGLNPVFSWGESPSADIFVFTLSTDPDFNNIIHNETLTETMLFLTTPLAFGNTYHWKVDAFNQCGAFLVNEAYHFETLSNLEFSLFPDTLLMCMGTAASFNIGVSAGFSGPVSLNVGNFPGNPQLILSENPAAPGSNVTVNITGLFFANPGDYLIPINLSDGNNTLNGNLALTIIGPPATPVLQEPLHSATTVSLSPFLSWTSAQDATGYSLYIATDENFSEIIVNESLGESFYTVPEMLDANQWHYWQVVVHNSCGVTFSLVNRFKTENTSAMEHVHQSVRQVFPNPSDGNFSILLTQDSGFSPMAVYAVDGREIPFNRYRVGAGLWRISLSNVSAGVYLLKVQGKERTEVIRVLVN